METPKTQMAGSKIIVLLQCAWIEWMRGCGAGPAMDWIDRALRETDLIPDGSNAQEWFEEHYLCFPEDDEQKQPITLETAPIGTFAPAYGGGGWTKTDSGWRWGTRGGTFPRPGGDWNGKLIPPMNSKKEIGNG